MVDLDRIAAEAHERMHEHHERAARAMAIDLYVSFDALDALGLGWLDSGDWVVPMRDADRRVINLQTRSPSGRKLLMVDGRPGLFIPSGPLLSPVFVAEGASDTAALLTRRLAAVGKSAALVCPEETADLVELLGEREVIVVADKGATGTKGATHTANVLVDRGCSVKMLTPQRYADIRSAFAHGLTAPQLLALAERVSLHSPTG